MEALLAHDWPGNVRELESVLERAALVTLGNTIERVDLGAVQSGSRGAPAVDVNRPLKDVVNGAVARIELEYLNRVLEQCGGNVLLAAQRAGIDRKSFYRKMERHGVAPERFRDN